MPAHGGNQGRKQVGLLDKPRHAEHRDDDGELAHDKNSPGHKGADKVAVHHPRVAEQRLQLGGKVLQRLLLLHLIIKIIFRRLTTLTNFSTLTIPTTLTVTMRLEW